MARLPELVELKRRFGLHMISLSQLIEFRHRRERLVELIAESPFLSAWGEFTLRVYRSLPDGRQHLVFTLGQPDESPTLVRVQRENMLGDLFRGSAFGVERFGEELTQQLSDARGLVARLEHHGVSHRQRRHDVPVRQVRRKVERPDHRHHAEGPEPALAAPTRARIHLEVAHARPEPRRHALDRTELLDALKAKIKAQQTPPQVVEAVAKGDAEIAVFLANVLVAPGIDLVGPVPAPLQEELVFTAGIGENDAATCARSSRPTAATSRGTRSSACHG